MYEKLCPNCGSYEVDDYFDYSSSEMIQECLDCGYTWIDEDNYDEEEEW